MIFTSFFNVFFEHLRFDLKVVFLALKRLCGALLGYFELHFGSRKAPWELFGGCQRLLGGS